jgi:hypothetical protein
MSLNELPADLMTTLSQRLDGVGLVTLVKCGSKLLNSALRKSLPDLYFKVNHYGFLNIPQVLSSLSNLFPLARSHTFIDVGITGCQSQLDTLSVVVDLALLESTRLNISSFSFVGSGAFVRMMNRCLSMVESKLDDIFPNVVEWHAGQFVDLLPKTGLLSHHAVLERHLTSTLNSVVPSSATRVKVSSPTVPFYLNAKHQPLQTLALTAESIPSTLFASTSSFQSLTVLWICYKGPLNARDLPRGLTSFTAGSNLLLQMASRNQPQSPLILSNPPLGLEYLQLGHYNRLVFPKDEFAPLTCLKILNVDLASDLGHRLSASNLPKSLTLLYIGDLSTSVTDADTTSIRIDEHLFANVNGDAWVNAWPTQLRIEPEEEMDVLMERLIPFADVQSCRYTLQCAWKDASMEFKSASIYQLKQRIGASPDTLSSLLAEASHHTDGLFLRGEVLSLLYDTLRPGEQIASKDLVTSITTLSINNTCATEKKAQQLVFIRENIHRLCPCIASLKYFNYVDGLPIGSSIRSLTIDQFPTKPLNITSSDLLESLTITAEQQLITLDMIAKNPMSLNNGS